MQQILCILYTKYAKHSVYINKQSRLKTENMSYPHETYNVAGRDKK